jgi:hypothetical protein
LLNNNRVFEGLEDTVKDLCSLRKQFVEGVQNAYENHLSSQQPRDRVQVYEVQVDGLKNQAVALSSTAGNASTVFCFTICPEGMLKRIVLSRLRDFIAALVEDHSSEPNPKDMLVFYHRNSLRLTRPDSKLQLVEGTDNRTAWALEVGPGDQVLKEVGWGIIQG